jgi:hypothetical protein
MPRRHTPVDNVTSNESGSTRHQYLQLNLRLKLRFAVKEEKADLLGRIYSTRESGFSLQPKTDRG